MGSEWGPEVWKRMAEASPNKVFKRTADRSAKRLDRDRQRKDSETGRMSQIRSKYMRSDDSVAARRAYSLCDDGITPDEVTNDNPQEHFKQLMSSFYSMKVVNYRRERSRN